MKVQSSVGKRCEAAFNYLNKKNYESALLNLFPALDKTAKKRRPKDGVGMRVKSFMNDEIAIITYLATGNIFMGCQFGAWTIPDAIYKMGRNSIMHEGELDPRLSFVAGGNMTLSDDKWVLPEGFIWSLLLAIISAPENAGDFFTSDSYVQHGDKRLLISELWGNKELLVQCFPALNDLPT